MYPRATWRLLLEPAPQPGARAMATDEVLLRAVAAGEAPPTLRLYTWAPPALTLGRGQPCSAVDLPALLAGEVTLLRRATGGTAVYHDETELTYAVAVPSAEMRFAGDVRASYRGVGAALLHALAQLGLSGAEAGVPQTGAGERHPVCFVASAPYEVTVAGRKLVGSAQMRVRGGILQHGSLYLRGDVAVICAYLAAHPDPTYVRERALTLDAVLGRAPSWEALAQALVGGFAAALNLELLPGALSPAERASIERLVREKYADPAWTRRL